MSTENLKPWSLDDLDQTLRQRKRDLPEGSYTASLFRRGTERIAQKVGEEGVEVAIAATRFSLTGRARDELVGEVADLVFSVRLLLVDCDIPFTEVIGVLEQRNAEKTLKGGGKNG